jgi:hypothetical protein
MAKTMKALTLVRFLKKPSTIPPSRKLKAKRFAAGWLFKGFPSLIRIYKKQTREDIDTLSP